MSVKEKIAFWQEKIIGDAAGRRKAQAQAKAQAGAQAEAQPPPSGQLFTFMQAYCALRSSVSVTETTRIRHKQTK